MLYHHLFGTGNILKYFLINHVPAIGFAPRLCRLIPDSRHDSWHERQGKKNPKNSLSQFFISVNHSGKRLWRGEEEEEELASGSRSRHFCPASSEWLTGRRHADAPVSHALGQRGGGMTGRPGWEQRAHARVHIDTPVWGESNPHVFIMLSVYLYGYALCSGLRRQTDSACIVW